jgi:opine dehydrogenase
MSVVAVLGAGAGGLSCSIELTQAGHEVRLWNRHSEALAPYVERRQIPYIGVLGDSSASLAMLTTDLAGVIEHADVIVVSLPALAHDALFRDLANLSCSAPIVLNPGHTGGALHVRQVFRSRGVTSPPVCELSTLTYVARARLEGGVRITCRAPHVRCGALPGGEEASEAAAVLFPGVTPVRDVLASSLSNINLVLHPPGAILAAAWVEAPDHDFTFYVEGLTPGVSRVIEVLDAERREVAARFGHDLPSLIEEMALVGTVPVEAVGKGDVAEAIRSGEANRTILAPDTLLHRYYQEDLAFGLVPFVSLANIAGVAVPMAQALLTVGGALLGRDLVATGLGAAELGVEGLDCEGLVKLVRSPG